MKKVRAAAIMLSLALALSAGLALAASAEGAASGTEQPSITGLLPIDIITYQESGRMEIHKVYELNPEVDPGLLPIDSFSRNGLLYDCADIIREVVIGEETKTVTLTESAESRSNDMDSVLALFPQYYEYTDEDGFSGSLLLNTGTIASEVAGYGTSRTPYTVTRNYPNLSNADTAYIPKTIDDEGRTLDLQNIQWRTDNTMNVDDHEIANRYTAIAAYGGTRTSRYVSGYTLSADYSGDVLRKCVTVIRYTVIFTGIAIPAPLPSPEAAPEPVLEALPEQLSEPEPAPEPVPANITYWLPVFLSIMSLIGSSASIGATFLSRKESPYYEKSPNNSCPDAYSVNSCADLHAGDRDS